MVATQAESAAVQATLDQPGKGLPLIEGALFRYMVFPVATKLMSDAQALTQFNHITEQVTGKLALLDEEALHQRVLITRLPGLEDSSRYWSVAMVIDHLMITGRGMQGVIEQLTAGQKPKTVVRIEDVKPSAAPQPSSQELILQYQNFAENYQWVVKPLITHFKPWPTHPHPWFGEISAHQWHCLNTIHHQLHLRQLEKILSNI